MITLSATNHSIDVTMTAITTNQVEYVVAYADEVFTAPGSHGPVGAITSLSGPGPSTVLSAPAAGVVRQLKYLSIANKDTVANTQNIQFNVGGTRRTIIQVTLQPGESLHYLNDASWRTYTATGAVKAVAGDVVGPTSATDNAIARFDTTTGKLIQNSVVTVADTTGSIVGPADMTIQGSFMPLAAILAADFVSVSTTIAEVTGLRIVLPAAGSYIANYNLYWSTAAATTGINVSSGYSGTTTSFRHGRIMQNGTTTAGVNVGSSTTQNPGVQSTQDTPAATSVFGLFTLAIVVSTPGNLTMSLATEVAASAATLLARSNVIVQRVS